MNIQTKLEQLRQEWTEHPEKRDIIEIQAKILRWKPKEYTLKKKDNLIKNVADTLL